MINNEASWDSYIDGTTPSYSEAYICMIAIKSHKKHLKSRQRFINDLDSGKFNLSEEDRLKFRNQYRKEIKWDVRQISEWIGKLNTI